MARGAESARMRQSAQAASIIGVALPSANGGANDANRLSAELCVGALRDDIPIWPNDDIEGDRVLIRHSGNLKPHLAPIGAMADHAIPARLRMIAGQPAVLAHQAL